MKQAGLAVLGGSFLPFQYGLDNVVQCISSVNAQVYLNQNSTAVCLLGRDASSF